MSSFAGAVACSAPSHRFVASVANALQGSTPIYSDALSNWNLTAAVASVSALPAAFTSLPLIGPGSTTASSVDLFSSVQQAWQLRGSDGLVLQPGAGSMLGSSAGFSLALWFRVDAAAAQNPKGNVLFQLTASAQPAGSTVSLTLLSSWNTSGVLSLVAQFDGPGSAMTTDADYAVSSSTDEFGPTAQQPNQGNAFAQVGNWQHCVVTFNGAGLQTGLFWNGQLQDDAPHWDPLNLGLYFGGPAPYGPIIGGSLGFDSSVTGVSTFSPLIGALGDLQIYNYQLDSTSVVALYLLTPNLCTSLPSPPPLPPLPPAPPGGYSPPPPHPSPPPPRPPVSRLVSGVISFCLSGVANLEQLELEMERALVSYISVLPSQVQLYTSTPGCNVSQISSRRLLQAPSVNGSTVKFLLEDLTPSVVAVKLTPLYGANSSAARAALAQAMVSAGVNTTSVAPLGSGFVTTPAPPPVFRPPLPPGATPASLLAANNAGKHADSGLLVRLRSPGAVVGYTIAALAVLFLPVYLTVQCLQAGHARRTCVSVALVLHVGAPPSADQAPSGGSEAGGEGEATEAARFGAPLLSTALVSLLTLAVSERVCEPKKTLLRPLLRAPLLAALGQAAKPSAALPGDDVATLALRHKPNSLRLKAKRSLRTELHWQARELRQLWRRVKRFFSSRSKDTQGKVFRTGCEPVSDSTHTILVEVTWSFRSRDGASAWRHRMRDESCLAALEASLQSALISRGDMQPPLELQPCVGGVMLALLDDEPHARLDKKRGGSGALKIDPDAAAPHSDERSHGLSPAVAVRLQEVLRLSSRSLARSRSSTHRSSSGGIVTSPRADAMGAFHSARPSVVEEEEEEAQELEAVTRVEMLAAVSTSVDQAPEEELFAVVSTSVDEAPEEAPAASGPNAV